MRNVFFPLILFSYFSKLTYTRLFSTEDQVWMMLCHTLKYINPQQTVQAQDQEKCQHI